MTARPSTRRNGQPFPDAEVIEAMTRKRRYLLALALASGGRRRRGSRSARRRVSAAGASRVRSSKTAEAFPTGRSTSTSRTMSSHLFESNMTRSDEEDMAAEATGEMYRTVSMEQQPRRGRGRGGRGGGFGGGGFGGGYGMGRWAHRLPRQRLEFLVPPSATDLAEGQPEADPSTTDRIRTSAITRSST